jgi:hypothetical protein
VNQTGRHRGQRRPAKSVAVFCTMTMVSLARSDITPAAPSIDEASASTGSQTHMPEALRSSVSKVVIVGGESPDDREVSGTYEKETRGLVGGIEAGQKIGTISRPIGDVSVNFPIPGVALPGAIIGGISGATERQVQEFRDRLTEDLARAESRSLTNDGLALDVYSGLRSLPTLESRLFAPTTPVPDDTDAVLFVNFEKIAIEVEGKDAIITTSAKALLKRVSDGADLYERVVQYQDRDTLTNWTRSGNALWHDYVNFARHYLGRELSAEVFSRVSLQHELLPKKTDTAKPDRANEHLYVSRTLRPTLAWELTLADQDSYGTWANAIDDSNTRYDLEIYDNHRPVYSEENVQETRHTVAVELEACQTYRWTVRPTYHADGDIKFGEWMRLTPDTESEAAVEDGISGRQASEAPAYIQDFALLEIKCGSK